MKEATKYTNSLIQETSPYLLQHAHNPVDWRPWNAETLALAKSENKPIIISIGYSACHWCHVMEHESFEDESVAKIMNQHFICIKVDREERPDIDQVYMGAVQLMTGQGGWPLNCVALPDGRPFYGGTYFKKEQWLNVLEQLADMYQNNYSKVLEYAEKLTKGMNQSELVEKVAEAPLFEKEDIIVTISEWSKSFDSENGGPNRAPKFPMPNNLEFLLYANYYAPNAKLDSHIDLTLEKMARGGIYDQIGGGFARYSVDPIWKVPHFEKMLYDNAQLISVYSKAYQLKKNPLYKQVVDQTIDFLTTTLMHSEGYFYSALDADSEGIEGKFYVWTKAELKTIAGTDYEIIEKYYYINSHGYWEHDNYILMQNQSVEEIAAALGMPQELVEEKIAAFNNRLLKERDKRIAPGLDDKTLTSWNAMMISGLLDAHHAFQNESYLDKAITCANFIIEKQLKNDGSLWHSFTNGKSTILGFLEDYAFCAQAFLQLFETTGDEKWLKKTTILINYCYTNFQNQENGMFYFTDQQDDPLITRKVEFMDNVIPSSNSVLAIVLFKLGHLTFAEKHLQSAKQMLQNVHHQIPQYGSAFSNWGILLIHHLANFYEVAIIGKDNKSAQNSLMQEYIPNKIVVTSKNESTLEILKNRFVENKTYLYVCTNKTCNQPTESFTAAIEQLKK
jgi:hypothetical protein